MDLLERIKRSQIKYNEYTVQCIDAYLNDDKEPLSNFLVGLSRLNRGILVLGDDFQLLIDAFQKHDTNVLLYIKHKLSLDCSA